MSAPQDEETTEKQRRARRQGLAYQGAGEAVFAILIATGIGIWADSHFETTPRYLLLGMAVGFAAFVLRLLRLGRTVQKNPPETGGNDS